jgi:hypothetical protein
MQEEVPVRGNWLRNLALVWQLSNDLFGRIKGQPIEDRYLPDSSNPRRTTNSRNKRCALARLKSDRDLIDETCVLLALTSGLSMPEVQKGNDVEQDHAERQDKRDGAEPNEHESAVVGAGRRRGNSNDVVKSSEYLCEEFDHGGLRIASASRSR